MSSQPSGGPAIPAAAAVAGLETDEDESTPRDDGVPVGSADAKADVERARERGDADSRDAHEEFVSADLESQTDDGVPVGRADAEQDRLQASSEDNDD